MLTGTVGDIPFTKSLHHVDWYCEKYFLHSIGDAGIISIFELRKQAQGGCPCLASHQLYTHREYKEDEDTGLFLEDLRILAIYFREKLT